MFLKTQASCVKPSEYLGIASPCITLLSPAFQSYLYIPGLPHLGAGTAGPSVIAVTKTRVFGH
jgi:hypothetical protein